MEMVQPVRVSAGTPSHVYNHFFKRQELGGRLCVPHFSLVFLLSSLGVCFECR